MKLYNTLTRKIEEFIPNEEGIVKLYTCGPTVYHFAHIGNLRTYLQEDILEKTLTYLGYKVDRVMNITDVGHLVGDGDSGEDKMAVAAKREKKSSLEIAKYYTECFRKDCDYLNIKWPETVSPATENIDEYIKIITSRKEDFMLIKNLNMSYSNQIIFDEVDINIPDNEKIGLVGINGSGKTTLFKIIMKELEPDTGKIIISNPNSSALERNSSILPALYSRITNLTLSTKPSKPTAAIIFLPASTPIMGIQSA